jgi:predicted ATPase
VRITRWCVLTGAPCSGKTSVIEELHCRGFRVVHEAARALIDAQLREGRRLEEIKADAAAFEGRVFRSKLAVEKRLPAFELVFLDRALPDSIAYYRLEGLDPAQPRRECRRVRYHRVFLLDRLQFTRDPVRSEDAATAERIEALIVEAYQSMGYPLIRVPVVPVAERADYIEARV